MKKFSIDPLLIIILLFLIILGYLKETLYLVLSFTAHELGHLLILKFLKIKINKLTIYPYGGVLDINLNKNNKIEVEVLIYLSGIIMNIILLIIGLILSNKLLINFNVLLIIIYLLILNISLIRTNFIFNKFILDKYLYPDYLLKLKRINKYDYRLRELLYKGYNNYIFINDNIMNEREILCDILKK